jgi:pseudaminic acid cytidylyltransferase
MNIAIIPARGGSKRIHKKNIKLFYGKPMIAYSIEAALESGIFDEIYISTDDNEIAEIAKAYGAKIPFMRPSELADDYTATVPVIKHAIEYLDKKNITINYACCIYATAPFIQPQTLRDAYNLIKNSDNDYCFPITEFDYAIQRALVMNKNSQISMLDNLQYNIRSQDLEPRYHDVGQFYMGTVQAWKQEKPILASRSIGISIPRKYAQDIDTPEDWKFAEYLYGFMKGQ